MTKISFSRQKFSHIVQSLSNFFFCFSSNKKKVMVLKEIETVYNRAGNKLIIQSFFFLIKSATLKQMVQCRWLKSLLLWFLILLLIDSVRKTIWYSIWSFITVSKKKKQNTKYLALHETGIFLFFFLYLYSVFFFLQEKNFVLLN